MYATKPVKPSTLSASAGAAVWRPPLDGLDALRAAPMEVEIPVVLTRALLRLRLLEGVPLAWLVPDPALLPPESIRFFHVDPTWTDRLVDGALSAGRVGSLDLGFTAAALAGIRQHLDEALEDKASGAYTRLLVLASDDPPTPANLAQRWQIYTWPGRSDGAPPPLSGMLIRSEMVTRWPDFEIRASRSPEARDALNAVPILRRARLGDDLMIVLFAGSPQRVEFEEPPTGIRFGVEPASEDEQTANVAPDYIVQGRESRCQGTELTVPVDGARMISLTQDAITLKSGTEPGEEHPARGSQWFAWWFLQPPYIQVFSSAVPELSGSDVEAPETILVRGRHVRYRPTAQR